MPFEFRRINILNRSSIEDYDNTVWLNDANKCLDIHLKYLLNGGEERIKNAYLSTQVPIGMELPPILCSVPELNEVKVQVAVDDLEKNESEFIDVAIRN